jgi:hypothetical protein
VVVFLVAFMEVRDNKFLQIVDMEIAIFTALIISGFMLILTACVGVIAVLTQNHGMSMIVSSLAQILVRSPGPLHNARLLGAWHLCLNCDEYVLLNLTSLDTAQNEFGKSCKAEEGAPVQIDSLYLESSSILCTKKCPCSITGTFRFTVR